MSSSQAKVFTDLNHLNGWRFHVKPFKLGHQQILRSQGGGHPSPRKGRGMEFSEVRLYQPGDDVRHMDWRVTARTQKPHTKLFTEEHERPVIFLVEQSAGLFFGTQGCFKSVRALDALAILAWAGLNQGDKVGGMIVTPFSTPQTKHWHEPQRRPQAVYQLFESALKFHQQLNRPGLGQAQPWVNTLEGLVRFAQPASKIILIGDLFNLNERCFSLLGQMARHSDFRALHICDPLEMSFPNSDQPLSLSNGENATWIHPESTKTANLYKARFEHKIQDLAQQLSRSKTPLTLLKTNDEPISTLLQTRWLRR